jgi:hypothetical protein
VATKFARDNPNLSQRSIYDERYSVGLYDRSVPVLTAERDALHKAMERASISQPFAQQISLFDFAYGTGRVINDWLEGRARQEVKGPHDLRVVVYDVSSVGLRRGLETLCSAGYEPAGPVSWDPHASQGYIAGAVRKQEAGHCTSVVFVHGCEGQPPEVMRQLALAANDGDHYLLTTSWRSGLGHIPSDGLRREYLRQLSELTLPVGEMILCLSSAGDLAELQPEWSKRLASGDTGGFPIQQQGDVVYRTELGQENFCHLFGTELNEYMASIAAAGQYWWIEGLRYPGEEFKSTEDEHANYRLVREANLKKRGQVWGPNDYREFHTVAAFRSPLGPGCGDLGRS